jgi:hypothetical protein
MISNFRIVNKLKGTRCPLTSGVENLRHQKDEYRKVVTSGSRILLLFIVKMPPSTSNDVASKVRASFVSLSGLKYFGFLDVCFITKLFWLILYDICFNLQAKVSNLPLLFVRQNPTSLELMSVEELQRFLRYRYSTA